MEIGVYGLGRFGFLWAKLLAKQFKDFKVKAYSRNPRRETPEGVERVAEDEVLKVQVLFLCNSISSFEDVIKSISCRLKQGMLVMDTCSVKVYPVHIMQKYLPKNIDIIATHPMFGPDSACNGFCGLPIIICPVRAGRAKLDKWKMLFTSIGLKVLIMSPEEHDYKAAFTQGITHYVGRVLADLDLKESEIATLGYKKLLEIKEQTCNDPWQLFTDLQMFNPYTREMREKLHLSLKKVFNKLKGNSPLPEFNNYYKLKNKETKDA